MPTKLYRFFFWWHLSYHLQFLKRLSVFISVVFRVVGATQLRIGNTFDYVGFPATLFVSSLFAFGSG